MSEQHVARRVIVAGGLVAMVGCACGAPTSPDRARGRAARATATVEALPPSRTAGTVSFEAVLRQRRSVRAFTSDPATDAQVGQLLWAAQGITHDGDRRTAPSAGALYPLEVYAVTSGVVRRYLPAGHRVERWGSPSALAALAATTPNGEAVAGAPVVFVVTEVPARTEAKYGRRAQAFADLEAGHATQNLVLQAVARGLGAVTIGALEVDGAGDVLGLPDGELARYLVPVGHPS
jgi:SagB-type dehydrogenase family enzyme